MNRFIKKFPDYFVKSIGLLILYAGFGMLILWGWDFLLSKTTGIYKYPIKIGFVDSWKVIATGTALYGIGQILSELWELNRYILRNKKLLNELYLSQKNKND
jgi:hypothetical protein